MVGLLTPVPTAPSRRYGAQSMVAPLRRVLVRRPDASFGAADPQRWHYRGQPDLARACDEHGAFVALLEQAGIEVIFHGASLPCHADALFVHDPALVTDQGTFVLRMGKELRRGEEEALAAALGSAGVPVWRRLGGEATAEGGDLLWIDHDTLAVGQGFRTNRAALLQLQEALAPVGVRCVPVELPVGEGADACLHLMSLISMIDEHLAVAHEPLLPVSFWCFLRERNIEVIAVPARELPTQGPNVLALSPRRCLMLEGNPITQRRLLAAGCEVVTYCGDELSLKAEGGPTCLTRPVQRAP